MARFSALVATLALALLVGIAALQTADAAHPLFFARLTGRQEAENATASNDTQTNEDTLGFILGNNSNYSIYNELVSRTEFFSFLNETEGNYTVFAPTNEAFETLPEEFLGALNSTFGGPLVVGLLSYTVINGSVLNSTDVPDGTTELTSLLGLPINVTKAGDTIALTGESSDEIIAIVVDADRNATNGVIHGINAVPDPLRALRSTTESATETATEIGSIITATSASSIVETITATSLAETTTLSGPIETTTLSDTLTPTTSGSVVPIVTTTVA